MCGLISLNGPHAPQSRLYVSRSFHLWSLVNAQSKSSLTFFLSVANARAYRHSQQRAVELPQWLHRYNWHRPHASLKGNPPISRLGLSEDNVLRLHI